MALRHTVVITPDDVENLPKKIKRLYVGGAGTLKLALSRDEDADAQTINVVADQVLDNFDIRKIFATGTTATGLIGYY